MSPGFHRSLAVRRLAGRDFTDDDDEAAPRVAVINERLARRLFAGRDPLGQRLTILRSGDSWVRPGTVQIVGVVSDMKEVGLNEVEFNDISLPLAQHPPTSLQIVATTSLPLASIVDPLRRAVVQVDPNLPVSGISAMPDLVDNARRGDRVNLLLIASFAIVAILMAGVGIYGAMSYAVAQRTQELGVRLALGARPGRILGLAIGEALRMGMMGTALGLLSVLVLARALGSALYLVPATAQRPPLRGDHYRSRDAGVGGRRRHDPCRGGWPRARAARRSRRSHSGVTVRVTLAVRHWTSSWP